MDLSTELIDYLHNEGRLPEWAYFQLNGRNISENYIAQKKRINNLFKNTEKGILDFQERKRKEVEEEIISQATEQIPKIVGSILEDLYLDF